MSPRTTSNGIKLQWATVGIIVAIIIQIVMGAMRFSRVETNQEYMKQVQTENFSELKFRVGNIEDGMGLIQRGEIRSESRYDEVLKRLKRLEKFHDITDG